MFAKEKKLLLAVEMARLAGGGGEGRVYLSDEMSLK